MQRKLSLNAVDVSRHCKYHTHGSLFTAVVLLKYWCRASCSEDSLWLCKWHQLRLSEKAINRPGEHHYHLLFCCCHLSWKEKGLVFIYTREHLLAAWTLVGLQSFPLHHCLFSPHCTELDYPPAYLLIRTGFSTHITLLQKVSTQSITGKMEKTEQEGQTVKKKGQEGWMERGKPSLPF